MLNGSIEPDEKKTTPGSQSTDPTSRRTPAMVLVSSVVSVGLLVSSCGDDPTPTQPWNVNEASPEPMIQGTYDVEFEIIRDECEPSLRQVTRFDDWLPKQLLVSISQGTYHDAAGFISFRPRLAYYYHVGFELDQRERPLTEHPFTTRWTQPYYYLCPSRSAVGDEYAAVATVSTPATGVVKVDLKTHWLSEEDCPIPPNPTDATLNTAWIPRDECKEEFVMTYRNSHECPTECNMRRSDFSVDSVETEEYTYPSVTQTEVCTCPSYE